MIKLCGGSAVGFINGLLGAGGGMLAVPLLKRAGLGQKSAHATSIAVIWPLSAVSAAAYLISGGVQPGDAADFLLPGVLGAVAGGWLMGRIPGGRLRRLFGIFMIWAGIRLLLR